MTEPDKTALEAMLSDMSHQDVARFKNTLDVDDPRLEVVLGYMEAHDIDD